jgi:hypothetical protein
VITEGIDPFVIKKLRKLSKENVITITNFLLATNTESNPSKGYRQQLLLRLCELSKFVNNKEFRKITREDLMKLENILKNKDKYIIELIERNEGLGTENQKLKEKMQANTSEGVLRVKVVFQRLYRDMLLIRNLNTSQAIIHISNGEYVKLEPR